MKAKRIQEVKAEMGAAIEPPAGLLSFVALQAAFSLAAFAAWDSCADRATPTRLGGNGVKSWRLTAESLANGTFFASLI